MAVHHIPSPPILFFLLLSFSPLLTSALSDSDALLKLKGSFENANSLESWSSDSEPCTNNTSWVGIICFHGIVTGLRLGRMGLSGKIDIDALLQFPGLRTISFIGNQFDGPIPSFNQLGALKSIYLSRNRFSGEIPSDFFSNMASLKKLWLDSNDFSGPIPESVSMLPRLKELHLENNRFLGRIPSSIGELPLLNSFNVSNNELEGRIPAGLEKIDASAFAGNVGLCGAQVGEECNNEGKQAPEGKSSNGVVVFMVLVLFLLLLVVTVVRQARKKRASDFSALERDIAEVEEEGASSTHRESRHKRESVRKESRPVPVVAELVVVNDEKGAFGLTDLMKAAAEVLGAGGLGSAYKAVMAGGRAVVVKRLREMDRIGNDGFEEEMRRLGRLRHPNVLPLLAFHSRKEEKLLVLEFAPRGSLLYLLHGDRGQDHADLNWPTRLKIIGGIARGMAYLHAELAHSDLPHGNLRSSNVLLGNDFEPLITDYGYFPLVAPLQATQSLLAYKAPESIQYNHVSPKSDVFCLGILILEIITGKFPSLYLSHGKGGTDLVEWVSTAVTDHRESQLYDPEILGPDGPHAGMERLLHLGLSCANVDPTQRPTMREATKRIEEIVTEEGCGQDQRGAYVAQASLKDGHGEMSSGGPDQG
ncbi:pollen receptor-like kinase 3 [Magnolia sinica]|uniref:pollen receptor-like kinase 3 n=1 Tax=Magnolia sinica TaxID=86752 RepID=UPI002657BAAA|nr:pollen receptor-like kinase 3 [Magnolia sinica]